MGPIPGVLFQLPAGFKPSAGTTLSMSSSTGSETTPVLIFGSGVSLEGKNVEGLVLATAQLGAAGSCASTPLPCAAN